MCVYVASISEITMTLHLLTSLMQSQKAGLKFVFPLSQHSMFRDYNCVPKLLTTRHFYMRFSSVL